MRILLLEDHPESAAAVRAGLERSGFPYQVEHFTTLKAALKRMETQEYDAALVDLGLPDAQGTKAAIAVKTFAPDLPVLVLTGEDFNAVGVDLIEHGIQDYLQKGDISVTRIDQSLRMACARQHSEQELKKQAAYDSLTGLMNRAELDLQLRRTINMAERQQHVVAILAIDLDGFKIVNDAHGHRVGDAVLKKTAERLMEVIRASDCAARVGGDEFIVVLGSLHEPAEALPAAERIRSSLSAPVAFDGLECVVTASIGIAYFPEHSSDRLQLWDFADQAMYSIKRTGKGGIQIYHPTE